MGRKIVAVAAGIFAGFVIIFLVQILGHFVYPPPEGINSDNKEALAEYINNAPVAALILVLQAYAAGSFTAGVISKLVDRTPGLLTAVLAGTLLMITGIINFFIIPHPVWFIFTSLLIYIPLAYLGGRITLKLIK